MEAILYPAAAVVLAALVQWLKFKWPNLNPLLIGAVLSLIGGVAYAVLLNAGLWEAFKHFSMLVFTGAVAVYAVFVELMKLAGADTKMLKQPKPEGDTVDDV